MTIPHVRLGQWPEVIAPARMSATIARLAPEGCRVALIGLPDDTGVKLNGGRPGASEGPTAFRAALAKYGVAAPHGFDWPKVFDAGDVVPAEGDGEEALLETHRRISEAVTAIVEMGLFPIAVGGGHDLTLPFVRAVVEHHRRRMPGLAFGGVYFDAHLDVRESIGSGMPFRRLMEDHGVGPLNVIGFSPMVNAREHVEYFRSKGGLINGLGGPGPIRGRPPAMFVSLDMDVFDQSHAPGVSAMNPTGMVPAQVAGMLTSMAVSPDAVCFDIMELCPAHDEGGRTARVAAAMFLAFLMGLAGRV